jgi:DNA-binding Lrp family transcriptional regulator
MSVKKQKTELESPIEFGNGPELDELDLKITNELLDDSDISSTDISKKFDKPLSTIQRRRTKLERTILIKDYGINVKYANWRSGEIFVRVGKGATEAVANQIFENYPNNVTLISTTMNNVGNMIIHIYFRTSPQMFSIVEKLKRMEAVDDVLYAEHIEVLGERKPRFILEDLMKGKNSAKLR